MTSRYEDVSGQWVTFSQAWTPENRLNVVTNTVTGQTTQYFYDGDGNRVKKVQNGVTTIYIGALYEKNLSTGVETSYYFAGSQRVAMRQGGNLSYFVADHLGSTSLSLDANGNEIANTRQKYYPFGETRGTATSPTDRQFTGQRREDPALGSLYDYGARFFSSSIRLSIR